MTHPRPLTFADPAMEANIYVLAMGAQIADYCTLKRGPTDDLSLAAMLIRDGFYTPEVDKYLEAAKAASGQFDPPPAPRLTLFVRTAFEAASVTAAAGVAIGYVAGFVS